MIGEDRIPEIEWRQVPNWPEYEVSNLGDIRPVGGRLKRQSIANDYGHLCVVLRRDKKPTRHLVHRLICAAFHGPSPQPGMQVAHGDGVPTNNRPENLRWATNQENADDRKIHGTDPVGSKNPNAKLSEEQVSEIIIRVKTLPRSSGGARIRKGALPALAAEYGVTHSCLKQIMGGTNWAHVSKREFS